MRLEHVEVSYWNCRSGCGDGVVGCGVRGGGGAGRRGGGVGGGTGVADISAEGMALAACISAVATTPVRGSPSHIHFLEGAFTAAVLLPGKAGGTSGRAATPRCDPQASAAQ